jgi:hypothetical protein
MWQNGQDIELPIGYMKRHCVVEVEDDVEEPAQDDLRSEKRVGILGE